jgi:hypothetical protein
VFADAFGLLGPIADERMMQLLHVPTAFEPGIHRISMHSACVQLTRQ